MPHRVSGRVRGYSRSFSLKLGRGGGGGGGGGVAGNSEKGSRSDLRVNIGSLFKIPGHPAELSLLPMTLPLFTSREEDPINKISLTSGYLDQANSIKSRSRTQSGTRSKI